MVSDLSKNKAKRLNKKQRKDQVFSVRSYIVKIMNAVSLLCLIATAGLLSAILYGQININDYKSNEIVDTCAYGFMIVAVSVGLLALALQFCKEDYQSIKPIAVEGNVNHKAVQEHCNLNENTASLQGDKVKLMACNDKQVLDTDASLLTNSNKSSSSSILQPAMKETQTSKNIENRCRTIQHSSKAIIPLAEKQLVPVKEYGSHSFTKNSNAMVQYPVQRWNFTSTDVSGNFPVTEVVTSRKVSYLGKNVAQEEFYMKRTYIHPQGSEIPSCKSTFNFDECFRKSEKFQKNPVSDVITSFESLNFLH